MEDRLIELNNQLAEMERKYEELMSIRKMAQQDRHQIREEIMSSFHDMVDDVDIIYQGLEGLNRNFEALDEQLRDDLNNTENTIMELRELKWRYEQESEQEDNERKR